jgi:hypothetical protein
MKDLPEINTLPVHELTLPILKQKVLFSPYTVEQERNILTSFESDEIKTVLDNYKKLIGECFKDPVDFDKLSAQEFVLMALNLRCKSKGEVLDITTKCQKCEKGIETSINMEDHIVIENGDKIKAVCKIDKDLSFEVVPVRMNFLYELDKIESDGDLMIQTAVHSINKVFWKEEIYSDFTPDTLREKVQLTYTTLAKIFEVVNTLAKMKMVVNIKCHDKEDCGHEEEYTIRDFLKYLN